MISNVFPCEADGYLLVLCICKDLFIKVQCYALFSESKSTLDDTFRQLVQRYVDLCFFKKSVLEQFPEGGHAFFGEDVRK